MSLGGAPVYGKYEPKMYGVPQIHNTDLETLAAFTSLTDKACLRDLLSCFIGEAAESVQEFLTCT